MLATAGESDGLSVNAGHGCNAVVTAGGEVTPNRRRKHVFVNNVRTKRDIYTTVLWRSGVSYAVSNCL